MEALLFIGAAAIVALIFYVKKQDEARRFARLGAVACSVCDQEGVQERGEGSYSCSSCGYDTDAVLTEDRQRLVREIQEISIAITCLEGATVEFHESRYRYWAVTNDGPNRTEHAGPFHDRYLEGIEQAEEASRILELQVDARPRLAEGLDALAAIPPPADGRAGFNAGVAQADDALRIALAGIRATRKEMVSAFRR